MANATFYGARQKFTFAGLTFIRGQERPVPDEVVGALAEHPWFSVADYQGSKPTAKRRGRPRKDDAE